MLITNKSNS